MLYKIAVEGLSGLIMHSASGMDSRSPLSIEITNITAKKGANRTEVDEQRLRELETLRSLWLDENEKPTIPPHAFRSCVEKAARKLKQGPAVREGLLVIGSGFEWNEDQQGSTLDELSIKTQYTVPVVVQRNRVLRTRARFDEWQAWFEVEVDDELVDQGMLERWIDIAGRRVGLGDWRPEKSGHYGRFKLVRIEALE